MNRPTIGFSEAAELPGVQEWELTPEEVASGKPLALALVKFRAVNALSIFIESNQVGGGVGCGWVSGGGWRGS